MSAEEDARATTERELQPRRWALTTRLSRLGTVAAVVLGVATGLGVSGSAWDSVLLSWLSGLPFSLPLAWHEALSPSAQGGAAATWSWVHLALGACTIASWTTLGVLMDLLSARRRNAPPPSLGQATSDDRYLAAAQADVEAMLRGEDRKPERTPVRRQAEAQANIRPTRAE